MPLPSPSGVVLYHWEGVGWCPGLIKEAGSKKRKQINGAKVNFEIHYEVDGDLSDHVLELVTYRPDGPANCWVLLEAATPAQVGAQAETASIAAAAEAVAEVEVEADAEADAEAEVGMREGGGEALALALA